ncbi:MAG TPA: aspartyl/asparaginyl beta-hydroxylase domain-containing protein [Acidisarcina sp.]
MTTITSDAAVRLPITYNVDLLLRDLQVLRDVPTAPQPGPYHKGEWTGIALHSMGGKDSVFPSSPGMDKYQQTENLARTPYFKQILDDLKCPKEVVRILFLPPGGHIKDHFDFHTSFQFGLVRLHIPILTDPAVAFVIDGERMNWKAGELWYGDFSKVHSVKNDSQIVRVHIVIDVQINDYLLSLFPEDFVERRKREGISMTRESAPSSEADLRRFISDFKIPGEFMPMFVIGKPLSTLIKGAVGSVRLIDGKLMVLINNEPAFQLERTSDDTFGISGLPPGITLQFVEQDHVIREVALNLKGLPKDLYSARLGMFQGPAIDQRRVTLPLVPGSAPAAGAAPGVL